MGPTAIAERKLEAGNPLEVLGSDIVIRNGAATATPLEDKVAKRCGALRKTVETMLLSVLGDSFSQQRIDKSCTLRVVSCLK